MDTETKLDVEGQPDEREAWRRPVVTVVPTHTAMFGSGGADDTVLSS